MTENSQSATAESPKRNRFRAMMKEGRFRALRNLPVGWVLQILHSTDATERWIRVFTELALIGAVSAAWCALDSGRGCAAPLLISFLTVHTVSWLLVGNFWVYMLDSFLWVRNPGIAGVLDYVDLCRKVFVKSGACDAILIYGSMCRHKFHGRSDLDLRVLRAPGLVSGIKCVYAAMFVKAIAFFRGVPVDLQVVDSMAFLKRQMRSDEYPIVVYTARPGLVADTGVAYKDVVADPSVVMRDRQAC